MVSANTSSILPKPKLSAAQILNMSFGFLGIQFGFALQNSFNQSLVITRIAPGTDWEEEGPIF
jgi:hypothetical protein